MKNEKYYKDTFNEVHVPEAVLRKVRDMKMEKTTIKRQSKFRYGVAVMAVLVVGLIASNGICYAATGSTWIGKMSIYLNGKKVEQDVTMYKDGDKIWGEFSVDVDEDAEDPVAVSIDGEIDGSADQNIGNLVCEEDKVYLVIGEKLEKIDITEDFADGECSGTFVMDDTTYYYEVTGNVKEYSINIK